MTTKTKNEKTTAKPKRLSLAEIFRTAKLYEESQKAEIAAKKAKTSAQKAITDEMERRKVKSLSSKEEPLHVTFVQNETARYDEDGLWNALTPAQRRLCFDRNINLNELSADARKRVLAVLTKEELAAVTTHSLDVEKLSLAVQERKIRTKLVAKFTEFVKSAPYIRVSHGAQQ